MPEPEIKNGLHVIALEADNFKRLRAVRVIPRGAVVEIVGRNAQGKSSVLDAIFATIGGASAVPEQPLRVGANSGSTYVDLGEVRVTRTYSSSGLTTLKVEARDGSRLKGPQAILDALWSAAAFDPLEFVNASPAKQAETLRALVGLDLSDLDRRKEELAVDRADLVKAIRAQEFEYNATGVDAEWESVPDEPVVVADLMIQLRERNREESRNFRKRQEFHDLEARQRNAMTALEKADAEVRRLETRLLAARNERDTLKMGLNDLSDKVEDQRSQVQSLVDPDTATIEQEIQASDTINRHVREKQERAALATNLEWNRSDLKKLGETAGELRKERLTRIARCVFPVAGIGFTEDASAVTWNGVPVSQASTAEAVVLGLALAAAMERPLRVARIQDGSLLDPETLAAVQAWAVAHDFQVFIERVGDTNSTGGVIIEDGSVFADRQPGSPIQATPRFGASALASLEGED